jgi:hypothetical protein
MMSEPEQEHEERTGRPAALTLKHTTLFSTFLPASKLTGIHIVQGIGYTIQVLEKIVVIDALCVRTHTVLVACHMDVWIHLAHSCSGCIRL